LGISKNLIHEGVWLFFRDTLSNIVLHNTPVCVQYIVRGLSKNYLANPSKTGF